MKERREEGNGNEVVRKRRMRRKGSDEANVKRRDQARGRGLNIDKIVIMPGTEEWEEEKETGKKTDRSMGLHLRWRNDRGKLSGGDTSSCPEFFITGFTVR